LAVACVPYDLWRASTRRRCSNIGTHCRDTGTARPRGPSQLPDGAKPQSAPSENHGQGRITRPKTGQRKRRQPFDSAIYLTRRESQIDAFLATTNMSTNKKKLSSANPKWGLSGFWSRMNVGDLRVQLRSLALRYFGRSASRGARTRVGTQQLGILARGKCHPQRRCTSVPKSCAASQK